jgi:quercetin dioxygenase-like cupin family protein|tara:strand:- start:854 stop:1297 length:444 start_codon:yes stop_codon:yes gene_type:complete
MKSTSLSIDTFRETVMSLERQMLESEDPLIVKGNSDSFPLTHSFSDGIYIREMSMLEGGIVIGKIHNRSHTWFLMKGKIKIANEDGVVTYSAPTYVNANSGAKRVIVALEDSVFVNVHPNPDNITDTDELERILTCETYTQYKQLKE